MVKMKRGLYILFFSLMVCSVNGQIHTALKATEIENQEHFVSGKINKIFIKNNAAQNRLKSATAPASNIEVTYINFPEQAIGAFEYAVSIWESVLNSPMPIRIVAEMKTTGDYQSIASAKPASFFSSTSENTVPNVLYPVALLERLLGKEINGNEADITCSFSSNMPWYFGLDGNTPATQYDFVTAVLHEIAHGLGFAGFLKNVDGIGKINNPVSQPSIFDYYLHTGNRLPISGNPDFPVNSAELGKQLTSENLIFFYPDNKYGEENTTDNVYSPSVWMDGASLYHLNAASGADQLMNAFARKGEAIHYPGDTMLEILSELGWGSLKFLFEKPADNEDYLSEINMQLDILGNIDLDSSEVVIVYSNNHFETSSTQKLSFDKSANRFSGFVPLSAETSRMDYYFSVVTRSNKEYTFPVSAPDQKFTLRTGLDNIPPNVQHNPVKIINRTNSELNLSAIVKDNIGISNVRVDFKIDGVVQDPLFFSNDSADLYKLSIPLKSTENQFNKIEYRIVAEDKSIGKNRKSIPATGYYTVEVANTLAAVRSYQNNFDEDFGDFIITDFSISRQAGFSSGILQTCHPYPLSVVEDQMYNLYAQLRVPVILQNNGIMSFSEVVLVEPGLPAPTGGNPFFFDYVVVEGSKDGGRTWQSFKREYDSQLQDSWKCLFTGSIAKGSSLGTPDESFLAHQEINLTENKCFNAGDTVLIRFRLSSDQTINGWGWGIDNLKIQSVSTAANQIHSSTEFKVFPNPFTNKLSIEFSSFAEATDRQIVISDISGRIVYTEKADKNSFSNRVEINTGGLNPGIYIVSVQEGSQTLSTQKIIKTN